MASLLNKQFNTWPHQMPENITNINTASIDNNEQNNRSSAPSVRKRTRATADQLSVLEDTFAVNVSPNSKLRKQLAEQLQMTERSIQIWFQNRRAKVKHMQKRAQMQMHQASIRAQYFHQQPVLQSYYYPARYPARAHSIDAVHLSEAYNTMTYPPYFNQQHLSWMPSLQNDTPLTRQSMPPHPYDHHIEPLLNTLDFPEYMSSGPSMSPFSSPQVNKSTVPTLISVPDAGPTAVLTTSDLTNSISGPTPSSKASSSYSSASSPETINAQQVSTIDPSDLIKHSSVTSFTEDTETIPLTPIDVKTEQVNDEEPKDLYLSVSALTIGTWHRLKMHDTDLVCVYRPDTRIFAWHIVDGGCHFKMEVAQNAVSSIEFVVNEGLADVHFDISEPPLFYMESIAINKTPSNDKKKKRTTDDEVASPIWVQCSDFTEGKQASRFFRHTLKGVTHHIKQELIALVNNHEETRRLVHFIEPTMYPMMQSQQSYIHPPLPNEEQLWMQTSGYINPTNMMYCSNNLTSNEPIACDLYMS